ncbi:MAG: DNA helicase II [Alphaproteobacteria bacterium]|nr:DNA helicase II [Alphaproteobacteria bacterium]
MADPFELDDAPAPDRGVPALDAPYLAGLNGAQRAAVEALDGPVLVLAGAGTGKTRVLTTRLVHLLATGRAWPSQILAVTFTNKAAREMRERVAARIGGAVEGLWLGTFHALSARILRRHAELAGLKASFTILDTDDQTRLLKQLLQAENVDTSRWPARQLLAIVQRWKDRGLAPGQVPAGEAGDFAGGRAVDLYRAYQARLIALNAVDFGDLMLHCLTLFMANPGVLADYQRQFKYILVDEYQDTNVAQYLWLRLLAQGHRNICCVGDDDQSIYGWRGAEVGNILRFEKDFPGAHIVRLEQNYRSTGHILAAATGLIAHNSGRLGKTLWTDRAGGHPVVVRGVWDGEAEARLVGETVEQFKAAGESLSEMAVLVRAGFQTREFEERFITLGLAYRVVGGARFYERQEIRDAVAYLRVVAQPDDDLAFERIVNLPRRGIGNVALQILHRLARAESISLHAAGARLIETDEIKPAARRPLAGLLRDFARWRAEMAATGPAELTERILDESGYTGMWQADRSPEAPGRLENLKELTRALDEFENLAGFLEHVSLVMENDAQANGDMISIMTLHSAKGLEFDTVFLPGWEEGLFPHQRALDESGLAGLEEERRLAHVGLTRARQRAIVSSAANRRIHNQWQSALPSRFIDELPSECLERTADTGLYSGGGNWRSGGATGTASVSDAMAFPYGGPRAGWRGRTIDIQAVASPARAPAGGFHVGDRVFHQKFGYGSIKAVDVDRLEIVFEKAGPKRVLDSFVERA